MLRLFLQALRPVRDNREIPLSLLDLLLEAGIPEKPECLEMNSRRLLNRESPPLQAAALVSFGFVVVVVVVVWEKVSLSLSLSILLSVVSGF
jgi:hypothetical protein